MEVIILNRNSFYIDVDGTGCEGFTAKVPILIAVLN